MEEIKKKERDQLVDAITDAFRTWNKLCQAVSFKLGQDLYKILGLEKRSLNTPALKKVAKQLIDWALAPNSIGIKQLVTKLREANPGNGSLEAFEQMHLSD